MAITDYRYDPFLDVINVRAITDEEHAIPTSSPFTIRLNEVPNKANPTTITVKDSDGNFFTEVSAQPSEGQYWPDYSVSFGDDWNTGTILFNAGDAGKTVLVTYNGMGTLVDERLPDVAEWEVTGSEQPERYSTASGVSEYDTEESSGSGRFSTTTSRLYQHTGLEAGTHTLREMLQKLINMSHTHEYYRNIEYSTNCYADCSSNCGDDSS